MSAISPIQIATSVIRACDKGLQTMYQIVLDDIPEITKRSVQNPKIQAPKGTVTAFISIRIPTGPGYLVMKVDRQIGRKLLAKIGFGADCSDQEVNDSIGELCNLFAGFFKTELSATGTHGIEISVPKLYMDEVDENIEGVDVDFRYLITVFVKGFGQLLNAEIAFKS